MLDNFTGLSPFETKAIVKNNLFLEEIKYLTKFHSENCLEYKLIINAFFPSQRFESLEEIPFIPVGVFKKLNLVSNKKIDRFKTLTSSGTSNSGVSKIYIDRETGALQSKVLSILTTSIIGKKRMPLIVIDCNENTANVNNIPAKLAAIRGFSVFSNDTFFALDLNGNVKFEALSNFMHKNETKTILLFGFTFIVWKNFISQMKLRSLEINPAKAFLLHGGGWKRAVTSGVSKKMFDEEFKKVVKNSQVINYYGMAEQAGSIFFECNYGFFHSSVYSDVIVRNYENFEPCKFGELGLLQVLSVLPRSYPGHSLLTEDLGILHGIDSCECGQMGSFFTIAGRAPDVEIRGCSDV
jgi:hypothetical protein